MFEWFRLAFSHQAPERRDLVTRIINRTQEIERAAKEIDDTLRRYREADDPAMAMLEDIRKSRHTNGHRK